MKGTESDVSYYKTELPKKQAFGWFGFFSFKSAKRISLKNNYIELKELQGLKYQEESLGN